MCGIIGIAGRGQVTDRLIAGLKRLEYRGYDSSGIAVLTDGTLDRRRAKGKIKQLEARINEAPLNGQIGIAHTRWATHGEPNKKNAHPHRAGRVAVVHNGIIENYMELREKLSGTREFTSDTDTEVVAHLVDIELAKGLSPKDAFRVSLKQLKGAYAFGLIIDDNPSEIFCARAGSPLALGIGSHGKEHYLGSDAMAMAQLTNQLIYLEEGDWAILRPDGYEIFDENDAPVARDITVIKGAQTLSEKGKYAHYMLKEIYEQPDTVTRTLAHYLDASHARPVKGTDLAEALDFSQFDRIILIACGTAYYAGVVAKYWFEQVAGLAVDIDVASEFRYRRPVLSEKSLFIAISQSGETADTLAALRYCKENGLTTAALVNVMTSTMAREADIAMPIHAGPEIGVASTKAFTAQLTALAALSLSAAQTRGAISDAELARLTAELVAVPRLISDALELDVTIAELAKKLAPKRSAFYLGRGAQVPIAYEGALKLKEISYIHAEGYAAGELKHGPIALIEDDTPVIVLAPMDELFEKTVSNLQEVASRGARVTLVTDAAGAEAGASMAADIITVPNSDPFVSPLLTTIALQLLAYHTAVALGTDVDQPRNLAKSVTVE